jgi:cardiolipin synthase A/B
MLVWLSYYWIVRWFARLILIWIIVRRRFTPSVAMAWLGLILFIPEVMVLAYLLLGSKGLGKRKVRLHRQVILASRSESWRAGQKAYGPGPAIETAIPIIRQAERTGGMPIVGGNDVELVADNRAMIAKLIADIDAAQKHVHLLYYIYEPDETGRAVSEALLRAVKRGVTCRLLVDAVGGRPFFHRTHGLIGPLRAGGVQVYPMLPVDFVRRGLARIDLRNHRKLAVIDGRIGWTGSQNVVNDDYGHYRAGHWKDVSGRFVGPVVTQLQTIFCEDWNFETDEPLAGADILPILQPVGDTPAQAVPTGPSHETETFPRVLLAAINAARRRLVLTTPYLVPDEPTTLALSMAADRGVQVDLIIPKRSDHLLVSAAGRAYYPSLMDSGINIYHYTAGLLHAKTITVDDAFALIGSANLDVRSFYLCFEISMLCYGPKITRQLLALQEAYLADATKLDAERWRQRPLYKRVPEDAAALLSPLL